MIKFLEKNYKWIARVLVIVWVLLILKLWLMWLSINSWSSGWFLALPSLWDFEYIWMSAWYISTLFLIISIYLLYKYKNKKDKNTKIKIALFIFVLWLFSNQIFLLFSPDFKFFMTPVTSQYKDQDWNVTDVDKYLEMIWKYCDYKVAGTLKYRVTRYDMCSENDKFQTFFKTADEYIKVLEYAKNHDDKLLYERTYWWVNKFWVEKILEKYDDVTFQAYVISNWFIDYSHEFIYRKKINNSKVLDLLNFYTESVKDNINLSNKNPQHDIRLYWENYRKELNNRIKQIPEINYKIF